MYSDIFLKTARAFVAFWFLATGLAHAQIELELTASHNPQTQQIVYTYTATNVGSTDAHDVIIWDGIPNSSGSFTSHVTVLSSAQSGFGPSIDANDTVILSGRISEANYNLDLNGDGDQADDREHHFQLDLTDGRGIQNWLGSQGLYAVDDVLAPGASITFRYTIQYNFDLIDPTGNTETLTATSLLSNTGYVTADLDNDALTPDGMVVSNTIMTDLSAQPTLLLSKGTTQQVRAGGSSSTLNYVSNIGTATAYMDFTMTDTQTGWSHEVWVNDGSSANTFETIPENLNTAGFTLAYTNDGSTMQRSVETLGIELQPDDRMFFVLKSFAPISAAQGETNTVTLNLNDQNNAIASSQSFFTISDTILHFVKSLAVDANCADMSTPTLGPDAAFSDQFGKAVPSACVIWQIVATNQGVKPIHQLQLNDATPEYTNFVAGSLRACKGNAGIATTANCTFSTLTDNNDTDEAYEDAGEIIFDFSGAGGSILSGGSLEAGESVTIRYAAQVS